MTKRRKTFDRTRRVLLGAAALLCFAGAVVLTPSGVRSQLDVRAHDFPAQPAPVREAPLAAVAPDGDAFAPRAESGEDLPPAVPPRPPLALPRPAPVPLPLLAARAVPPVRVRITAIATGANPTAIVDINGAVRIVTIGDTLAGSSIAAIDDDTVELANGRRLSLEPAAATP